MSLHTEEELSSCSSGAASTIWSSALRAHKNVEMIVDLSKHNNNTQHHTARHPEWAHSGFSESSFLRNWSGSPTSKPSSKVPSRGCTLYSRGNGLPPELRAFLYTAVSESILCTSITLRFGKATKQDLHRLQRIIRPAKKIIGVPLIPSRTCILQEPRSGQGKWQSNPLTLGKISLNSPLADVTDLCTPEHPDIRIASLPLPSLYWIANHCCTAHW